MWSHDLPTLTESPHDRIIATDDLIDAYEIGWAIDWPNLDIDAHGYPVVQGLRLIDIIPTSYLDECLRDDTDVWDEITTNVIRVILADEHDYEPRDALTLTVAPGGSITVDYDITALQNAAVIGGRTYDQAPLDMLGSLINGTPINLGSSALLLSIDEARAISEAIETIAGINQ